MVSRREVLVAMLGGGAGLMSCKTAAKRAGGIPEGTGPVERFHLEGVVVRTDADNHLVTIKHGQIANDTGKVWMEPMTMEFPVPDAVEFAKLQPGQSVIGTVFSRPSDLEYWVGEIREGSTKAVAQ